MTVSELINFAHQAFISCSEGSSYMALLLGSLIYLFCVEENSFLRYIVYGSLGIMGLFVFPPIIRFGLLYFGEQRYIKMLLVIPSGILISYAAVQNYGKLPDGKQKRIWISICVLLLLLSGRYVYLRMYSNGLIQNKYYVSDEEAKICSTVSLDTSNKILVCNKEIARAFRRINGNYQLLYGSDIGINNYDENIGKIYELFEEDVIPIEEVLSLASEEEVTHIVLYKWADYETPLGELLEKGCLFMIGETESYWSFSLNMDQ